jgi:CheY-specific phosphatase CheX
MSQFPKAVRDLLVAAVEELFSANGISKITELHDGAVRLEHCDFCSVIGFSGQEIKGNLILASPRELLDKSHPSKAMGMDVGEEDFADWIGEVSNQVVGRLKNGLLKFGANASLTTPTVLRGDNITNYTLKTDSLRETLHFQLDEFQFLLAAQVEILAPIDFSISTSDNAAEEEGSSLFF